MTRLAVAALLAAMVGLGHLLRRALGPGRGAMTSAWSWGLDLLAGLVTLHLLLLGYDLVGLPWTRTSLVIAAIVLAAIGVLAGRMVAALATRRRPDAAFPAPAQSPAAAASDKGGTAAPPSSRLLGLLRRGWGDAVALATVAVYAALAWRLRIATPDFVYHWGLKGHRYYLTRGIDWAFLGDPLHLTDHPDYPNLLPNLYAATAVVAGRFSERAMMVWSVVAFVLVLAAARECWARTATAGPLRQAGLATLALGVGMFAIGYSEAGGADWWIALALVAALPPLLAPAAAAGPADDLAVGLAAALAAGGKIEGVPLALFLVVLHLARRAAAARRLSLATALRAALPPLLVIAPWLWANLRLGLFQPADAGVLALGRAGVIFPAVAAALATPEWHGLTWSVLLLPVLVAVRPTRPLGLLVGAQALLYLYIYFSTPLPPDAYILASLPRLLFHLVPAILVGVAILAAATARGLGDR